MGRTTAAVFCLALLSGWEQQQQKAPPANAGFGRWMILSAGQDTKDPNSMGWAVWRLDTKTGDLEFCSHAIVTVRPDKPPMESGDCQPPIKAHPSDSKVLHYDEHGNRIVDWKDLK